MEDSIQKGYVLINIVSRGTINQIRKKLRMYTHIGVSLIIVVIITLVILLLRIKETRIRMYSKNDLT